MEDTILSKLTGAADDPRARQLLLELIGESALSQVLSGRIEFGRRRNLGAKKGSGPYGTTWQDNWWVKSSGVPINVHPPANSRSLGTRFLDPMKGRGAEYPIAQSQVSSYNASLSTNGEDDTNNWPCDQVAHASRSVSRSANSAPERDHTSTGGTALGLIEAAPYQALSTSSPWQSESIRDTTCRMTTAGDKRYPFQPSGRPALLSLRTLNNHTGRSNALRSDSGDACDLVFVPLGQAEQHAMKEVRNPDGSTGQHLLLFSALSGMHKLSWNHKAFYDGVWHIPHCGEDKGSVGKSSPASGKGTHWSTDVPRGIERFFEKIQPQVPVLSKQYYENLKKKAARGDGVPLLDQLELSESWKEGRPVRMKS